MVKFLWKMHSTEIHPSIQSHSKCQVFFLNSVSPTWTDNRFRTSTHTSISSFPFHLLLSLNTLKINANIHTPKNLHIFFHTYFLSVTVIRPAGRSGLPAPRPRVPHDAEDPRLLPRAALVQAEEQTRPRPLWCWKWTAERTSHTGSARSTATRTALLPPEGVWSFGNAAHRWEWVHKGDDDEVKK